MDSDLAESISALKEAFRQRNMAATFAKAPDELVTALRQQLRVPRRYRDFLLAADPQSVEVKSPTEAIRLVPAAELVAEQQGFALDESGQLIRSPRPTRWRGQWIIIGHSTMLGDPYFLDLSNPDAEGDCPVYTAMSGTEFWQPRLCASSFAMFLRILAVVMEAADDFSSESLDVEDEQVFRDVLGPLIRQWDPAAWKAGHWT